RPLKRAIQKYVEDEMAEVILRTGIKEGETVVVDFNKEQQKIEIKIAKHEKIEQ
ncbi:MAG TPA: hypothetical protein DEP22_07535, partial [Porphyromonadaceae bacterium]|nr:hypothetical protein [Porphyromonadaceae bacterium]